MNRIVKRSRSNEMGISLKERLRDNIDPNTGEQIAEKQFLVYWPVEGITRWSNAKHLEFIDTEEE